MISSRSAAQRINSGPSTPPMVNAPKMGMKVTTFAPTYNAPKARPCSRKSCCNFSQRDGSFSFSLPLAVAKARAGVRAWYAQRTDLRLRGGERAADVCAADVRAPRLAGLQAAVMLCALALARSGESDARLASSIAVLQMAIYCCVAFRFIARNGVAQKLGASAHRH